MVGHGAALFWGCLLMMRCGAAGVGPQKPGYWQLFRTAESKLLDSIAYPNRLVRTLVRLVVLVFADLIIYAIIFNICYRFYIIINCMGFA
nr:hypothetical protein CJLB15_00041 [Campylobacter phage CJLB-15]